MRRKHDRLEQKFGDVCLRKPGPQVIFNSMANFLECKNEPLLSMLLNTTQAHGMLTKLRLVHDPTEVDMLMRRAHINMLIFYLMTDYQDNHCLFYDAAHKLLGDGRIRGRRRALFEKFIGRMAARRLCGQIKDRRTSWED